VHPHEMSTPASNPAMRIYHTGLITNHSDHLEISHPIVVLVHSTRLNRPKSSGVFSRAVGKYLHVKEERRKNPGE